MVAIVVTPQVLSTLSAAGMEKRVKTTSGVTTVTHSVLRAALKESPNSPSLQNILAGAEVHLTHADAVSVNKPPQRNEELDARMQRLRARLHDMEYAHMVRDVSRASGTNAEIESLRMAKFAPQLSLGLNVIVTMATCFVAGYFVMKNTSGSETMGLVGGVAGMIIAMGVEAVLLLTKMYTIENAATTEVRKRDRAADRGIRQRR